MEENMPQGETGGARIDDSARQVQSQGQPNNGGQQNNQSQSQSGAAGAASEAKAGAKDIVSKLEAFLDEYMVKKAPFALPLGLKEFIAMVAPYLVIISAVFTVPVLLVALGLSTVMVPVAAMAGSWAPGVMISLVASAVALIMEVIAVPGLFKRTHTAWKLVFYATIVSLIGSILSVAGVVGGVIGAIIGWYILFQVKELYKN